MYQIQFIKKKVRCNFLKLIYFLKYDEPSLAETKKSNPVNSFFFFSPQEAETPRSVLEEIGLT